MGHEIDFLPVGGGEHSGDAIVLRSATCSRTTSTRGGIGPG
jgi:hypothetical protein